MRAHIDVVDSQRLRVDITAKAGPLRLCLSCHVDPTGRGSCRVTRIQRYPGMTGRVFTWWKGKREQAETLAYLNAWIGHARTLTA